MNAIIRVGVGPRVKAIRNQMGLSQLEMAKGILSPKASAKNIGRIEQGEVLPRLRTLSKIAAATNTDLTWLVTGKAAIQEGKPILVPGVGFRAERLRIKKGISQRKIATFLSAKASARNVGRIEQGEVRATPETLRKLARGLGTTTKYLINGS